MQPEPSHPPSLGPSTPHPSSLRQTLRRLAPSWAREAFRRVRDRVLRLFYSPQRFWERFGRAYYDRFPPTGPRGEDLLANTIRDLNPRSVLDAGCGYGRYLRVFHQQLKLDRLCGVDISSTQIAQARRYLADCPRVELFVAPGTRLPFPDNAFDVIHTYSLMIHMRRAEAEQFLAEAKRIARWGVFLESSANPGQPHLNPPYYFAHEYDDLFAGAGVAVSRRTLLNERTREYLYVVQLRPV